jgi:hypothetical protein
VNEQAGREELMSAAEKAFLLSGELLVLSFVAIYAFWFADDQRNGARVVMTGRTSRRNSRP